MNDSVHLPVELVDPASRDPSLFHGATNRLRRYLTGRCANPIREWEVVDARSDFESQKKVRLLRVRAWIFLGPVVRVNVD